MGKHLKLHTDVWYGENQLELYVPENWDLTVHEPLYVQPLTEQDILDVLERPSGHPPLSELCRGKSSPLVIVDDLNRPTPVSMVMPYLLKVFSAEGIDLSRVTIMMATGTHGPPPHDAFVKKIGPEAARKCRVLAHDCFSNTVKIGRTTLGTPVHINRALPESDLIIGVGGIYPNHTAGFGGGTKIILGVLGMRSIFHLHYNHQGSGWGGDGVSGSFRQDLDEIAKIAGLKSCISLQINTRSELINLHCGDPTKYYSEAVKFTKDVFSAAEPGDADVIISNAYPCDQSLTFAKMKGFTPFNYRSTGASRIAIAGCREGVGRHNIYPYVDRPGFFRLRHLARCYQALGIQGFLRKSVNKLQRVLFKAESEEADLGAGPNNPRLPIWMFRPGEHSVPLPSRLPDIKVLTDWREVVDAVDREQGTGRKLKVVVYPCSFLQHVVSSE